MKSDFLRIAGQALLVAVLLAVANWAFAKQVDVSELQAGELRELVWKGTPVLVYKRSPEEIEQLKAHDFQMDYPAYRHAIRFNAKSHGNEFGSLLFDSRQLEFTELRSHREDVLVAMGISPYSGCMLDMVESRSALRDGCTGKRYDLSGRLTTTSEGAAYHLLIPPHSFNGDMLILHEDAPFVDFAPNIMNLQISDSEKLVEAIQWRKHSLVLEILRSSPKAIEHETETGATHLHLAASRGTPEVLARLLDMGLEVNKLTEEGYGAVHFALMLDNTDNVRLLMKAGARVEDYCVEERCVPPLREFLAQWSVSDELVEYMESID